MVDEVRLTQPPAHVGVGEATLVCWEVAGTGDAIHMDVHVDEQAHAVDSGPDLHTGTQSFPANGTIGRPEGYPLPGRSCTDLVMASEDLYFVHVHVTPTAGSEGIMTRRHPWNVTAEDADAR